MGESSARTASLMNCTHVAHPVAVDNCKLEPEMCPLRDTSPWQFEQRIRHKFVKLPLVLVRDCHCSRLVHLSCYKKSDR